MAVVTGNQPHGIFSNDGRWLAMTGDREFRLMETGTWKPVALPLGKGRRILGAAVFSPDSQTLALVVDQLNIHLFDMHRLEMTGVLRPPGSTYLRGLAFSADGQQLAGVGAEARISLWNLQQTEERLKEFGLTWK